MVINHLAKWNNISPTDRFPWNSRGPISLTIKPPPFGVKSKLVWGSRANLTINHPPALPKRCQYDPKGWLMGTPAPIHLAPRKGVPGNRPDHQFYPWKLSWPWVFCLSKFHRRLSNKASLRDSRTSWPGHNNVASFLEHLEGQKRKATPRLHENDLTTLLAIIFSNSNMPAMQITIQQV